MQENLSGFQCTVLRISAGKNYTESNGMKRGKLGEHNEEIQDIRTE
jgi:hypothetical protein